MTATLTAKYLDRITDSLRSCELTTDHATSSYGIPVLVLANGSAYGPADTLPVECRDVTGADLVRRLRGSFVPADDADDAYCEDGYEGDEATAIDTALDAFLR